MACCSYWAFTVCHNGMIQTISNRPHIEAKMLISAILIYIVSDPQCSHWEMGPRKLWPFSLFMGDPAQMYSLHGNIIPRNNCQQYMRFLFQAFWTEHLWPSTGAYAVLGRCGSCELGAFLQDDGTSLREREQSWLELWPDRLVITSWQAKKLLLCQNSQPPPHS